MTYKFIVSTDAVNAYGYRILTDGIQTEQYMKNPIVLYMHNRAWDKGNEVIGRTVSLTKEQGKLIAEVEFDTEDEFAAQIAGKVERGYLQMCSMGADVIETSADPLYIVAGQTRETVTKCKMVELSIVDIGANDDALKLSKDGQAYEIKQLNTNDMNLKPIALSLALKEEATEAEVIARIGELTVALQSAEKELALLKDKQKAENTKRAEALISEAIALSILPEAMKDNQLKLFEMDFDGQTALLGKLIADKQAEVSLQGKADKVKEVILSKKTTPTPEEETFAYLERHNPEKLRHLRDNDPEAYARLAKNYKPMHQG